MNLIVEFEREQRFDLESKNEMLVLQMNKIKIDSMNTENRVTQQQETIRQQSENLRNKDELINQQKSKITALEESMKGLKSNFDDTYRMYNEGKVLLDNMEEERDKYLQKLTVTKQELAHASESVSDIYAYMRAKYFISGPSPILSHHFDHVVDMETRVIEYHKLMEMEQSHRCNLEAQMDELQKHSRSLVQQISDQSAKEKTLEKTIEEQKMQIEQLERVRYPLTACAYFSLLHFFD